MPRFRLQFSLATLLLGTTVVCVVVALLVTYRELRQARAQLQKYRDECGELTISDATRIHAIRVPTNDDTWRWRVFIPENTDYRLRHRVGQVPAEGIPTGCCAGGAVGLSPGEQVILAGVSRDLAGKRVFRITLPGVSTCVDMEGERGKWLDQHAGWMTEGVGAGSTVSSELGKPFTLLRLRAYETVDQTNADGTRTTTQPPTGPADGFLIWIEDQRGESTNGASP